MVNILLFLLIPFAQAEPKYGPKVKPLSARTNIEYFKKNDAADYWALSPYYLPQETPRGCSAANLAMILNAARVSLPLKSTDELITFKSLNEKFVDDAYAQAIQMKSITIGENFSNKNLARVLQEAAQKVGLKGSQVRQVVMDSRDLKKSKKEWVEALTKNEKSAQDFVFFSFMQGKVTGDPEGGAHVATVGAYDAEKNLVLVLDPDRQWYEPYWVSVDDLFEAMSDPKSDSRKEAGWIVFQTGPKS